MNINEDYLGGENQQKVRGEVREGEYDQSIVYSCMKRS
jgi:hypothetical protein